MSIKKLTTGITLLMLLGSGVVLAPFLYASSISSMSNAEICKRAAVNNLWTFKRSDTVYIKEALKRKAHCNITTEDRKDFSRYQNATLCEIAWANGKWNREFKNVIATVKSRGVDCESFLINPTNQETIKRANQENTKKDETYVKCTDIKSRNADNKYKFSKSFLFSYTEDGEVPFVNGYYPIPKSSIEYKKGRMYSETFSSYISKVSFLENGKTLTLKYQRTSKDSSGKQMPVNYEYIVNKKSSNIKVRIRPPTGYRAQFGTGECIQRLLVR
jgi:hypothetical protein